MQWGGPRIEVRGGQKKIFSGKSRGWRQSGIMWNKSELWWGQGPRGPALGPWNLLGFFFVEYAFSLFFLGTIFYDIFWKRVKNTNLSWYKLSHLIGKKTFSLYIHAPRNMVPHIDWKFLLLIIGGKYENPGKIQKIHPEQKWGRKFFQILII